MTHPILYGKTERNFEHLGVGVLGEALSCLVIEERNGVFELEMTYPTGGSLSEIIDTDMVIKADAGHDSKGQLFRISRIDRNMEGTLQVYARHVSYLAADLPMRPEFRLSGDGSLALIQWRNNIISDDNPFNVSSSVEIIRNLSSRIGEFDNARDVLGKIVETWGGEYRFDNYDIELMERRGSFSNTLISYGRNLTDLKQEENIAQTYTSIYPYAIIRESNSQGDAIQRIVTSTPLVVDSEHVGRYPNRRVLPVDFSRSFERDVVPDSESLIGLAEEYIEVHDIGVPRVSLEVSFADLTKVAGSLGLAVERVGLCDVVPVYFESLGIRARARVNRVRWDVLRAEYASLELGDVKLSLSDQLRDIENGLSVAINRPPVIDGSNIANVMPAIVTGLKVAGGFSQIHLFWDMQGLHIDYYEIERSMTEGSGFVRVQRSRVNAYSDTVGTNRQYFYRVRAVNFHGVAGAWSSVEGARTANSLPVEEHERLLAEARERVDAVRELTDEWRYRDTVEIDGGAIHANTVTAYQIRAGSITAVEIAAGAITADKIRSAQIDASHIRAGAITANMITAGTMHGDRISAGTLHVNRIQAGSFNGHTITGAILSGCRIEGGQFNTTGEGHTMTIASGAITVRDSSNRVASRLTQSRVEFHSNLGNNNLVGAVGRVHAIGESADVLGIRLSARNGYSVGISRINSSGTHANRILVRNRGDNWASPVEIRYPQFMTEIRGRSGFNASFSFLSQGNAGGSFNIGQNTSGQRRVWSNSVFDRTSTLSTNSIRMNVDASFERITSAAKYKLLIERDRAEELAEKILKIKPASWFDKGDCERFSDVLTKRMNDEEIEDDLDVDPITRVYGLVAEDVENAGLSEYVIYGKDREIEGVQYDRLWTLLIPLVREQKEKTASLQNQILELKNELEELKNGK